MNGFWRGLLACLLGLIAAGFVIAGIESLGMAIYPPPADMLPAYEAQDTVRMREIIASLPLGSLLFVLAAYFWGSFVGGLTAGAIAPQAKFFWPTLVIATVLTLCSILYFWKIPSPFWFQVSNLAVYFPLSLAGAGLAKWMRAKP